jgi:hypothetical protein
MEQATLTIPVEITDDDDPFYSAKNQAVLLQSIEGLERGECAVHELIEDTLTDEEADALDDALMRGVNVERFSCGAVPRAEASAAELAAGHKAMSSDTERETEAREWIDGLSAGEAKADTVIRQSDHL